MRGSMSNKIVIGSNIVPDRVTNIAAKARTRPLSCSGRFRSYARGHLRTHSIGIRRMPVAAIIPTKTCILTLYRGDLRGTAHLAWACSNWPVRRNARWDGTIYCCQHLHTSVPNEDGRTHSSRDLVCGCCAVLRCIHYRDVDNPRMSDEILRDVDTYAKSNVGVETPPPPNPVGQEQAPTN